MILEAVGICKKYKNRAIFEDFNFYAKKGEFVAIVGESGRGKSTLLTMLATLNSVDKGKIFFEKRDVAKLKESELSRLRNEKFGFVFQQANMLMHLNVVKNVILPFLYGSRVFDYGKVDKMAMEVLEFVGLEGLKNSSVKNLSGGELQRVAIARALINRPKIIFADEPTGNLDEKNSNLVMRLFLEYKKRYGSTIVMVTHDKTLLRFVDRVVSI